MATKNLVKKVVKDRIDEWKPVIARNKVFCHACGLVIKRGTPVFWHVRTKKIKHRTLCVNPFEQMVGENWQKGKQENLGRESYVDYLNSLQWKKKKKRYRKSGFLQSCWACEATEKIEFHHRTYNRLGCEAMSDILPLCSFCHKDLTLKYKSYSEYSDTFLWEFTSKYVMSRRSYLNLLPLDKAWFSLKLITSPHNAAHRCK